MSLGNLQYYFGSRSELLGGVLAADIGEYRRNYFAIVTTDVQDDDKNRGRELLRRFVGSVLNSDDYHEEVAVFRALFSFAEPEIVARLEDYYREVATLLQQGLSELSGQPLDSSNVKRAISLLLPYLDGHTTTASLLPLAPSETVELVTDVVWNLLTTPPTPR